MGRLVDLDPSRPEGLPQVLHVRVGDLLRVHASGGTVTDGAEVVRLLGSFTSAVLTTLGTVLAPEGAPNVVVLLVTGPGRAHLDLVTGDPWRPPAPARSELVLDAT